MKEDIRVHENYIYLIRSGNVFFFCERTKAVKSTVSRLKVYILRYLQNHLLHIKSELLSDYLRCMFQVSSQFTQNFNLPSLRLKA